MTSLRHLLVTAIIDGDEVAETRRILKSHHMATLAAEVLAEESLAVARSGLREIAYEPLQDPFLAQRRELAPTGLIQFTMRAESTRELRFVAEGPFARNRQGYDPALYMTHDFGIPVVGAYRLSWHAD